MVNFSLSPAEAYQALLALLFVSTEPLGIKAASEILEITETELMSCLEQYSTLDPAAALIIQRHQDHLQLASSPRYGLYIKKMLNLETVKELSPASRETLAIIAYKQPIDRAVLEAVRGIDCRRPLQSLLQKGLIQQSKTIPVGGDPRSFFYEVSLKFLEYFGLSEVEELKKKVAPQLATSDGK
jgi:segregation and condensation protein B